MKVLCFGSLNIDYTYHVPHFAQKGETLASDSRQVFVGGKGLNQSVALARAGAEVYHAGAIGEDGKFLLEYLNGSGVNTDHVRVLSDTASGHAIIQNDPDGDNCIILYGGANQRMERSHIDDVLSRFERNDFLVLQNEINELDYLICHGHERGMQIVLNPSPMEDSVLELPLELVDYLFVNRLEAEQILKEDVSECYGEQIAMKLLDRYPNMKIVLTLGEEGAVFVNSYMTVEQPAYRVHAVDTTAAGDTFTGFLIAQIMQGTFEMAAMDVAAKAAAICVTRPGAAPSIPTMEDLDRQALCGCYC